MTTETALCQVKIDGRWEDYARTTPVLAEPWVRSKPAERRAVDWIERNDLFPNLDRRSNAIECPKCYAPVGEPCADPTKNHIARGLALAVAQSPYEPVLAQVVDEDAEADRVAARVNFMFAGARALHELEWAHDSDVCPVCQEQRR